VATVREPLDRALALDAKNAQAISLSAYLLITDEMRWNDALARVQEAIALAPNHSGVNARHAFIQLSFGDFDAAVKSYAHVFSLDPLAPPARYHYALSLACAGRFEEAITCIEDGALALGESIMQSDTMCAVLDLRGDLVAAREYAEAMLARYPTSTSIAMHAAYCRAATGDSEGARALAERITHTNRAPQHYVHMYIESGFPDSNGDAFFAHAMAIAEAREPQLLLVPAHPLFKRFHNDPRWGHVLKKIGFPKQRRA
jgi:tetratricopeptide (TPR) repeat protein